MWEGSRIQAALDNNIFTTAGLESLSKTIDLM